MAMTLEELKNKYSPSKKVENEQSAAKLEALRQKYSPSAKVEAANQKAAAKTETTTATGENPRVADPAIQRQREKAGSREETRAKSGGIADAGTLLKEAAQRREEQLTANQQKASRGRSGVMPGQTVKTESKTPVQDRARMDLQNSVYDQVKAKGPNRLGKAAQSIGLSTAGSIPMLFDTFKQAAKNSEAYVNSDLDERAEEALNEIKLAKALYGEGSPEYLQAELAYQELRKEIQAFQNAEDKALSKDSKGYQMMDMAAQLQEQALEGTTGAGRWLGEAAFSIADNAAMLPMAVINPMLPGVMMGAKAAAGRSKALTDKGVSAESALTRGMVSGAIESVTEQMGIDNLFDIVKTGGKGALKNLLKQAGVEGTEEGFSYLFNYMADELAKDPDAVFSPAELFTSIAAGAVSGLAFGAGGTVVNRLGGGSGTEYSANDVLSQKGKEAQAPAEGSLHLQEQLSGQHVANTSNTVQRVDNANENVETIHENVDREGSLTNAGADLSDEGQQREHGAGARESAGSLGEGAGRAGQQSQPDARGRAKEARDLADALQVTAQSPRSLGISRGTEDSTMRLIPRESRSEYMNQVAEKVRQQTGREVDFFTGELRIQSKNARGYALANGCILPDGTIYVQADNESLTAEQIAMHESAHDLIQKSPGMMAQTIQQVQERYGAEALDEIVTAYLLNLRGIEGADAAYCQEEILCDAYAGINAFGIDVDVLQGDVQQSFTDYRAGSSQQERGTAYQRGPPAEQTAPAAEQKTGKAAQDAMPAETARPVRETNVTRDEETTETERPTEELSEAETALRGLREAYAAGEITDEEFDEAYADIMSEPEMQDRERLSVTEGDDRAQEQVQRYQRGEISLDELRGFLNGMQASQGQTNKNTARKDGVERYSINESFADDVDSWDQDGRPDGEQFILGSTGPVLQGLGAIESDIYMLGDKIKIILNDHPEMTLEEIKKIPQMMEDPVLILNSKGTDKRGSNSRLVVFGSVKAQNGQPIMSVLDLRPVENHLLVDDMQKVNSAYTKKNPVSFVTASEVLHADKKRTIPLLKSMGLQLRPIELLRSGSMGNISYFKRSVNISGVPFSDVVNTETKFSTTEQTENTEAEIDGTIRLETVAEEDHRKLMESLPGKARGHLQRVERQMVNRLGQALGVPYHAKREFLLPMAQELAVEYMVDGEISQGTKDAVFERAWQEGTVVEEEYYNQHKDLKDRLRTTAITLSDQDQADIPDWQDARKRMFGVLLIKNEGGMDVDKAYQELVNDYPGMFPADITHPADRLRRMFEVGRDIRKAQLSLEQYYGENAEQYKAFARGEFESNLGETLTELRNVKRVADEQAEKAAAKVPETPADMLEVYQKMKDARREYEKVNAKQLLADTDKELLNRAMRGEVNLDNIVDDGRYNLQGVKAVFEAKQKYEQFARTIRQYNNQRKAGLRNLADQFLQNAGSWKDKAAGVLYARETMERNIRDIVKDKSEASAVIREYFAPVHRNEAAANRMKNELRQKVEDLQLSRDVRKGDLVSEAHAVQLLGEAEDNIRILQNNKRLKVRDGKTLQEWQAVVENIWKESPSLEQAKIREGVKVFREIYDDLFRQMNEVRVRNGYEPINFRSGYFPHFQAEADGILAAFGKALGIDTAVNALPTSINGMTRNFKPGIRWVGNTLERIGFQTTYDAVEGFDRYIEGVADVIHHTDDIQKLRALASQVRYRTTDEGIRERVDEIRADSTLAEQDKENRIQQIYASGRFELGNFVVNLDEYTNLLANKKSESDRNMERMMGRRMYSLMKSLESRVAANMVAVNPASWLTNFIPITQGGAQLGPTKMLQGMWHTLQSVKTDDGITARSDFLTNRRGSDHLVMTRSQLYSAALSAPMGWIDNFTAGTLVRARYEQNLKQGMSEQAALEEADEWTAGVMADRSKGSMPTLFHASNPLTKLFTQFQLEVNNQLSYLFKDLPREQMEKGLGHLALALLKFFVGAWMYNEVYEYFIGRRPALDPIGILNETSGDLTGWELPNLVELGVGTVTGDMPSFQTEKKGAYEAVSGMAGNVAEELPFIGGILGGGRVPIQSALPDVENLGKVLLSDDWSTEKKWATAGKELLKPASYLVPPFGGGQLKKAIEGAKAWWQDGSYTVNAQGERQLQYPIFNDTYWQAVGNLAQATVFGKTTLPGGRDWIENDFKTFSVNETAAYEGMKETGLSGEDAYNTLLAMRSAKKTDTESAEAHKRRVLLESEISGDAKAAAYYFMFASDDERVMLDDLMDREANAAGAAEALMRMKQAEDSNGKRSVLMASDLTDWEKRLLYREKISDSRDEEIDMFKAAGLDMDDFLQVHNQYTTINGAYSSAGDKAMALSRWLNKQSFSSGQKETIKEAFKYYSQIPAEAARYDEFTSLGLSDDEAFRLTEDLSKLQPMAGKKSVSGLQKWQTVVDAGLSSDKQMAALESVMSESEYSKLTIGSGYGIEPRTYVQFKEMLEKYDANGNGSYNQEEIEAAIDAMSGEDDLQAILMGLNTTGVVLTNEQKAVLWQLQSTSTSAKNNPYSRSVGEIVLKLKNGDGAETSDAMAELEALLGS